MLHEVHSARSPEDTRNKILAATRQLLAKQGRRGTTTREIAEIAGVNEATIFRHFGNKDALIDACVLHYCPALELQEMLGGLSGDLAADLRQIGYLLGERIEEVRDLIVMSLFEDELDTPVGAAAWRAPTAIKQVFSEYMAQQVESGNLEGDPLLLARTFMGMIFSYVISRRRFPEELRIDLHQMVDFQVNVFLNGVRKKQ